MSQTLEAGTQRTQTSWNCGEGVSLSKAPEKKASSACPDTRPLRPLVLACQNTRGQAKRASKEVCGVGRAWEAPGAKTHRVAASSRCRGRGRQAEHSTAAVIDLLTRDDWIIKDSGRVLCKLSSNLAKKRRRRVEGGQVPFLHLQCKHVTTWKLFTCPRPHPAQDPDFQHYIQSMWTPVLSKKSCRYGGLIFYSQ